MKRMSELTPVAPTNHPRKHSWMMVACCAPMLVLAIALVAMGVVSVGFLFLAVGCTAMMAMMMGGMDRGNKGS